jgi:hypothetical protein
MARAQLNRYTLRDCTHWLVGAHQSGRSRTSYRMPCKILKRTKSGLAKVVVFGNRFWAGREQLRRIRYVEESRLEKIAEGSDE